MGNPNKPSNNNPENLSLDDEQYTDAYYPMLEGETKEQYDARLKKMREDTAKFQAEYAERKAKEDYENSEQGKMEAKITAEFDRLSDKLDQAVEEGKMSAEHAERLKEMQLDRSVNTIAEAQQDYQDRQAIGDPEEEAKYRAWQEKNDAENMSNLKERDQNYKTVDDNYNAIDKDDKDSVDKPDDMPGDKPSDTKDGEKTKVEIGEIDIEGIEQEFAEDKSERLAEIEKKLDKLLPEIAELYAKNRRLFVGSENRASFIKVRGEYSKLLDEYLRLKGEKTFEKGKHEIADKIEKRVEELRAEIESKLTEFAGGSLENTEKTQEELDAEKARLVKEAEEALRKEYGKWSDALKEKVNADFIKDYIEQEAKLESATIDKLNNGNTWRKFVNKVINNKVLKGVLIGAAVAGLAVTGIGLAAAGTAMTVSLGGFTAHGIAAGAIKGGASGLLMSRQNSSKSAIRGFKNEEAIKSQLKEIDITEQDADTANVADWLMKQYGDASSKDRKSNIRKTLIATGLGAALGALTSGIQIKNAVMAEKTTTEVTGNNPIEYNVDANIAQVNQPKGYGLYEVMRQMGVPKENWEEALKIAYNIEPNYGLSPGSNGVSAGFNGVVGRFAEAYPGPINTWPDTAQSFITETAKEWARHGFIQAQQTGGEPIYNTITNTVTNYIPNAFANFLTRNAAAFIGGGAIGGTVGGFKGTVESSEATIKSSPSSETSSETSGGGASQPSETAPAETKEVKEVEATEESEKIQQARKNIEAMSEAEKQALLQRIMEAEAAQETSSNGNEGPETEPEPEPESEEESSFLDQDLRNVIGEAGVKIMMDENENLSIYDNSISEWWSTLDDNAKSKVISFESSHRDSKYGRPLRNWLKTIQSVDL